MFFTDAPVIERKKIKTRALLKKYPSRTIKICVCSLPRDSSEIHHLLLWTQFTQ